MSSTSITSRSISDIAWLLAYNPWTVAFIAAFVAPTLLVLSLSEGSIEIVVVAGLAERLLQLLVIGAVFRKASLLLTPPRFLNFTPRFILVGLAIEVLISGGTIMMLISPGIGSMIMIVALLLLIRSITTVILYPMPFMDPLLSFNEALYASKALSSKVKLSSIALWPIAIFLLVSGLSFAQYPDGRLWWSGPLTQGISAVCHLIFVYRCAAASALATGLRYVPNANQRFGSPAVLAISGLALWVANLLRAYTLSPAPSLEFKNPTINEQTISLEIRATDSEFSFRGFTPQRFFIGGANGYPVTGNPTEIDTNQDAKDSRRYVLKFKTERKSDELVQLEDLYLWYGAARLQHTSIKKE